MPEPIKPPTLEDQYDIGTSEPSTPAPLEESVVSPPVADRERGPDGRFAKPLHPRSLVARARIHNLSEEDIASSTTDELDRVIYLLDQRQWQEQQLQSQARGHEQRHTQALGTDPVVETVDWGKDSDGREYKEDDYAPAIANLIKSYRKEMKELRAELGALKQHHARQADLSAAERWDAFFAKHSDVYGKGKRSEVKDGSREMARRVAVIEHAMRTAGGKADPVSIADKAHDFLYGDLSPQRPSAEEDWMDSGLARPSHRQGPPEEHGREAAIKGVRDYQRANGISQRPRLADEFPG